MRISGQRRSTDVTFRGTSCQGWVGRILSSQTTQHTLKINNQGNEVTRKAVLTGVIVGGLAGLPLVPGESYPEQVEMGQ